MCFSVGEDREWVQRGSYQLILIAMHLGICYYSNLPFQIKDLSMLCVCRRGKKTTSQSQGLVVDCLIFK